MCFNEPDYITVYSLMNILTAHCPKGAQNIAIIFLSYFYLSFFGKGLLQANNEKSASLIKLLYINFRNFMLLNHG